MRVDIKTGGREIKRRGGEDRQGGGCVRDRVERERQGVSNYILGARNVDNVTGEFRNIGKMVHLSSRPRRRGLEKGKCEWFMIGEEGEFKGFKEETEMAD